MARHSTNDPRRKRAVIASILAVPCALAAFVACGDDDNQVTTSQDAGPDGQEASTPADTGGPPVDAGPDAAGQIARGKYLVDHVAACGDCHTPRLPTGAPDTTKLLSGVECLVDVNGPAAGGCLNSANLTGDPTGLKNRTDEQIKTMFQDGKRPDGKALVPVMPYFIFHNMKAEDADAIVAYLRTVPAVAHQVPANDPPFDNIPAPASPVDPTTIPTTDGGPAADRGRYLATMVAGCLDCHTVEDPPPAAVPLQMAKAFGGGRPFAAAAFNLPSPPFPETIYTANLTPHATGLAGWTVSDIVRVLKEGKDRDGGGICPPMPAGPMAAFGGLTDEDALDIATYITGLAPLDNAVDGGSGSCVAP